MPNPMLTRLGAASGAVSSVVLFVAVGDGSGGFSSVRYVFETAALTGLLAFFAYLIHVLRENEVGAGWLSVGALSGGVAGLTTKLISGAPDLAADRAHVSDGDSISGTLDGLASALTLISLIPLAIMCAAVAVLVLTGKVLPRWIGIGAAATALALLANGAMPHVDFMWGLLAFNLWTTLTSVALFRSASRAAHLARSNKSGRG